MNRSFFMGLMICLLVLTGRHSLYAQYPPAVGQVGSTAIFKDSAIFIDWAENCYVSRGYIIKGDTGFIDPDHLGTNRASYGSENDAFGKADNNVVSLGDAGVATVTFSYPIVNGPGFDFAVFENSFDDFFLELAFIEVSSDGVHFVRFPSVSLTPTSSQISSFGQLNTQKLYNLAGKYKALYGTPFDLNDLVDSISVNINHITHVRIVDVVGSIQTSICSFDSKQNIINDPYPTPYWSSGFDLDAVGVIHNTLFTGILENEQKSDFHVHVYESRKIRISSSNTDKYNVEIYSICGRELHKSTSIDQQLEIFLPEAGKGIYIVRILTEAGESISRKIILD